MSSHRHIKRIIVMQTLYEWEFLGAEKCDPEKALHEAYQSTMEASISKEKEIAGVEYKHESYTADEWTVELLRNIVTNIVEIRAKLTQYAPEWPLEKIASVDRAILYIGIYEVLYSTEVPEIVAINEAVELAKSYGSQNSSKFVNGVLNSIYQKEKKLDGK